MLHRVHISQTTTQMGGLTNPRRGGGNAVRPAWYILCVTCGWREKAGDEDTAKIRAERHQERSK